MTTSPPDVGDRLARPQPVEPTPPPQPPESDQSNATRYLCVGAQIDGDFGDQVIRAVIEQHHRAVAPSFGLDLIPVVVHALNGRSRRKRRDLLLVLLAGLNLLIAPVTTIVTALGWLWMRFVYRLTQQQRPSWHRRYALYLATFASLMVVPVLALTALLLSVVVGLLRPYVDSMPLVVAWPARLGFWLPSPLRAGITLLSLGLAWSVLCWHRLSTRRVLIDTLRPAPFRRGRLHSCTTTTRASATGSSASSRTSDPATSPSTAASRPSSGLATSARPGVHGRPVAWRPAIRWQGHRAQDVSPDQAAPARQAQAAGPRRSVVAS